MVEPSGDLVGLRGSFEVVIVGNWEEFDFFSNYKGFTKKSRFTVWWVGICFSFCFTCNQAAA